MIKLKEWLARVKTAILSKILTKLSSVVIEGYSHQLNQIEQRINKLCDKLPNDSEMNRIETLANTATTVSQNNLRKFSDVLNKISNDDVEKITTLAVAMERFEEQDVQSISKLLSIAELHKMETIVKMKELGLIDISADELGSAKTLLSYMKKMFKEDLGKHLAPIETAKLCQDVELIKRLKRIMELFKLEKLTPKMLLDLDRDVHIIKWFLKSEDIEVSDDALRVILGEKEKEDIDRKITFMEEEELEGVTALLIKGLFHIGCEQLGNKQYKEACEKFGDITEINSKLKGAWLNKGIAYGGMGEYDKEIQCYVEALKIDPKYKKAKHNKAYVERIR